MAIQFSIFLVDNFKVMYNFNTTWSMLSSVNEIAVPFHIHVIIFVLSNKWKMLNYVQLFNKLIIDRWFDIDHLIFLQGRIILILQLRLIRHLFHKKQGKHRINFLSTHILSIFFCIYFAFVISYTVACVICHTFLIKQKKIWKVAIFLYRYIITLLVSNDVLS